MLFRSRSDAFVVLPGGIGTLEEIIELLSWRRLDLHRKPIVFHNPDGFWDPLFALLHHTIERGLTPPALTSAWVSAVDAADVGTWDLDIDTGVLTWSERCYQMFGVTPGEPVDIETAFSRIHPGDEARVREATRRAMDPAVREIGRAHV